jgi:aromatic ring-opening dioxygenase catalytic subunit (LigB family)
MFRQPAFFIPHGGGPCFFVSDPSGHWTSMGEFLGNLRNFMLERPKAILIITAHWETEGFALTGANRPQPIYDYYGFPPHTYQIRYDAPGEPQLAAKIAARLIGAGLNAVVDQDRGYDHGVFIPLKVAFPEEAIPVVAMSVDRSLDPALHIEAGKALSALRDEGVAIIGSGMSFHNLQGFRTPQGDIGSRQFDRWLHEVAALPFAQRNEQLVGWRQAPGARTSHPREEHLIPMMVAAGASEGAGEVIYSDNVLGAAISAIRFS